MYDGTDVGYRLGEQVSPTLVGHEVTGICVGTDVGISVGTDVGRDEGFPDGFIDG